MKEYNFPITKINSYKSYKQHASDMAFEYDRRLSYEKSLISNSQSFTVEGFCYICKETVQFEVDFLLSYEKIDKCLIPNWRERLVCPLCKHNNRKRAFIHLFEHLLNPKNESKIYIAEQTPVFFWLADNYPNVTESDYLGKIVPYGTNRHRVRNEDLTELTFADNQFNFVFTIDCFEHIPNYPKAFKECFRVLSNPGYLLFSVPFDMNSEKNIIRAVKHPNGAIEHIFPPEMHGHPLNPDEHFLAFYNFGWEILSQLKESGFLDASAILYWSDTFGYLGREQFIFLAEKA